MKLRMFLAHAATAACACAADGQILINQAAVMAGGGFPYTISQPGSYKLSGSPVAAAGKQAILIAAGNVVLDPNGFNISCSLGAPMGNPYSSCVGDSGTWSSGISHVSVRNGTVTMQAQGVQDGNQFNVAIGFAGTPYLLRDGDGKSRRIAGSDASRHRFGLVDKDNAVDGEESRGQRCHCGREL